jgi:succinyl-diaminopimelate desuccinylase
MNAPLVDAIVPLTEELIRFRTTHSRPDEIRRCAAYIEDWFSRRNIVCRRMEHAGVPSVVALPPSGHAPVLLMSHIDVVEGPESLFVPRVADGRIYGRGSLDDKYAAALSMVLMARSVQEHRDRSPKMDGPPLGILITGDEEAGGFNGAKRLLKEIHADFCIALDGGSVEKIVVKEKGLLKLRLVCTGKAAHGSRPWLGENAIESLIEDYTRVRAVFGENRPDAWHRTLNFSMVTAGSSFNQVPDRAEAVFDIRYTENDDPDELVRMIQEVVSGKVVVDAKEPLFFAGDSPFLDRLRAVAESTTTGFEHGASDARFLSDVGIPGIVWGADGDRSAHAADEHVEIDSIARLAELLERFLETCRA